VGEGEGDEDMEGRSSPERSDRRGDSEPRCYGLNMLGFEARIE